MVWIPRRRRERCSTIMLARASPAPRGHVRVGVCVSVLECRGLRGAGSSIKYHCIDLCSFFRERERCRLTLTVTAGTGVQLHAAGFVCGCWERRHLTVLSVVSTRVIFLPGFGIGPEK